MSDRKEGFYWIKINHEDAEWEIAKYWEFHNGVYFWHICGYEDSISEESIQIGDRVPSPEEF